MLTGDTLRFPFLNQSGIIELSLLTVDSRRVQRGESLTSQAEESAAQTLRAMLILREQDEMAAVFFD